MIPVVFINCNSEPFVDDIMCRLKEYETRSRNTLGRFIGEQIMIAETSSGKAPVIRCSAIIDQIITVRSREEWEEYLDFTWVPGGSRYDWKPETKVKYLYHLTDVRYVTPFTLPNTAIRHGRVWAEYEERSGS